jgi:hypothetical protein
LPEEQLQSVRRRKEETAKAEDRITEDALSDKGKESAVHWLQHDLPSILYSYKIHSVSARCK